MKFCFCVVEEWCECQLIHAISEELEEHNAQVIKKYDSSGASSKKVKQGGGDNNLNSTTTNNVNNSTSKYKV